MGGWDEMLPTVAMTQLPDGTRLPDHGEAWRVPWAVLHADGRTVSARVRLRSLPLQLTRAVRVLPDALRLDYQCRTFGHRKVPVLWAAHPLFAAPPHTQVLLQRRDGAGEYPVRGRSVTIPQGIDDLGGGQALKAFVPGTAWAAVRRPSGAQLELTWDPALLPWLGVYLDRDVFTREPVIALEPTTGPGDDAAQVLDRLPTASARAPLTWWLELRALAC